MKGGGLKEDVETENGGRVIGVMERVVGANRWKGDGGG